jgi:hypothetical protein
MSSNSKAAPIKRKTVATASTAGSAAKRTKAESTAAAKAEPDEIDLENSADESETEEQPTSEDLEFIADEADHGLDADTEKEFQQMLAALRGGRMRNQ